MSFLFLFSPSPSVSFSLFFSLFPSFFATLPVSPLLSSFLLPAKRKGPDKNRFLFHPHPSFFLPDSIEKYGNILRPARNDGEERVCRHFSPACRNAASLGTNPRLSGFTPVPLRRRQPHYLRLSASFRLFLPHLSPFLPKNLRKLGRKKRKKAIRIGWKGNWTDEMRASNEKMRICRNGTAR